MLEDQAGRVASKEIKLFVSLNLSDLIGLVYFRDALGDNFVRLVIVYNIEALMSRL